MRGEIDRKQDALGQKVTFKSHNFYYTLLDVHEMERVGSNYLVRVNENARYTSQPKN